LILQHCGFAVYNACLLKIHVLMLQTISIRMLPFLFNKTFHFSAYISSIFSNIYVNCSDMYHYFF
jgi:hypothetical protein